MKKILITGGKGFFSKRLTEFYKDQYEFIVTDKEELDIVDNEKVEEFFTQYRPDYVIHAAAIAVTDFCNKRPDIAQKINVDGAVNVARAAKRVSAKLVFLSSEQVFNGNENAGPFSEEDVAVPNTVYGANKLEAEALLKDIIDELWIVRFTWMFGLPERNNNMVNNILWDTLTSILKNEKIYASPHEFRGMTYVYDMIENFEKVFSLPFGTYHLGSINNMSRYEMVKHIFSSLGIEERINELVVEDTEKYSDNPRDIRLVTDKAKSYGIEFPDSGEAMRRCVEEYKIRLKQESGLLV
ncbi:NAD(P)-dependent oxidoreductase [Bacillus sp. HMF5848]|uniref:SDR family oxidoreductase n=1 Tax=Bacillus sp. HMF5848 TaxID=2495421 RepID=UPI000F781D9D|nr:sugar nucleotide-binding protein [Bacillus sp. HMF5848]RSK25881.1 NAD(P)-dependent oxidoreductase [Bacillus sp. HMF5848]